MALKRKPRLGESDISGLARIHLVLNRNGSAESDDAADLDKRITELERGGKYQEAFPIADKLLQRCEELMGAEHPATAILLGYTTRRESVVEHSLRLKGSRSTCANKNGCLFSLMATQA
jgi:hypothetical protein